MRMRCSLCLHLFYPEIKDGIATDVVCQNCQRWIDYKTDKLLVDPSIEELLSDDDEGEQENVL